MSSDLRHSVLVAIAEDGSNVAARLANRYEVSRQTASAWLAKFKKEGVITASGVGRGVRYQLATMAHVQKIYPRAGLLEDRVWAEAIAPVLSDLPGNIRDIWHYAVTEMVNNAIDHSGSETVAVELVRDALNTTIYVADEGEGIFLKIQRAMNLYDPREAILELAKGKLTTDPANHTGEGIFFSSKVMDAFDIRSGQLHFMHDEWGADMLLERPANAPGTLVLMRLANDCPRHLQDVFDQFAAPEEYTFAKTIVPVRLAQHEGEKLVSRSQAKRLTMRFERFQVVVLDFAGVEEIGQAFADEVFRVFSSVHPMTQLLPINLTPAVEKMVKRAMSNK
jgi:anti-sigma regulatory factor (Ser/Thr protein kinase)